MNWAQEQLTLAMRALRRRRMSYAAAHPGYRIDTTEQATAWVEENIIDVEHARALCDVQTTPEAMRKAWSAWMVKHGSALGILMALHRCGRLSDLGYNTLRARVMATMTPTILRSPG